MRELSSLGIPFLDVHLFVVLWRQRPSGPLAVNGPSSRLQLWQVHLVLKTEEGLKRLFSKQPRDPRFLPLAGAFSADKFRKSYGFLTEAHKTELTTLRESLKQARKLLASSPKDLYTEREAEVKRLEVAVKRAESQVNKDRQDRIEQEAIEKLTAEEREKQKEGKEQWHLKKCKCWDPLTARDAH